MVSRVAQVNGADGADGIPVRTGRPPLEHVSMLSYIRKGAAREHTVTPSRGIGT